jgi:hypothetical protein
MPIDNSQLLEDELLTGDEWDIGFDDIDLVVPDPAITTPSTSIDKVGAAYALASDEPNPDELNSKIKDELVRDGYSPTMREIKGDISTRNYQADIDALNGEVSRGVISNEDIVEMASTIKEPSSDDLIYEDILSKGAEKASYEALSRNINVSEVSRIENIQRNVILNSGYAARMAMLFDSYLVQLDDQIPKAVVNEMGISEGITYTDVPLALAQFSESLIFPTARLANVVRKVIPEEERGFMDVPASYILGGSLFTQIGDYINSKPVEERYDIAVKVLDAVITEFSLGDTEASVLAQKDAITMIRRVVSEGKTEENDWLLKALNIIGIVDVAGPVIHATSSAIKAGLPAASGIIARKVVIDTAPTSKIVSDNLDTAIDASVILDRVDPSDPISTQVTINPESSDLIAGAILDGSGVIAGRMGVTRDKLISSQLPQPTLGPISLSGMPPKVIDEVAKLQNKAYKALELPENTFNFTQPEIKGKIDSLYRVFADQAEPFAWRTGSFQAIQPPGSNVLEYKGVFGKNELVGFESKEEAEIASKWFNDNMEMLEGEATSIDSILYRDDVSNTLLEADTLPAGYVPSEWFVRTSGVAHLNPYDAFQGVDDLVVGGTNLISRTLLMSPHEKFSPLVTNASITSNERKFFIKHRLFDVAKPFTNLKVPSQRRVAKVIEDGDRDGEVFSYLKLKSKYELTDKEIIGYYSARAFWDASYFLKNAFARRDLINNGYRKVTISDPIDPTIPVYENAIQITKANDIPIEVLSVFDLQANSAFSITNRVHLQSLLDVDGYKVGKALKSIDTGTDKYNYILVPPSAKIGAIPDRVINHRTGGTTLVNNDAFYVVERRSQYNIDGRVSSGAHERVLWSAESRVQAQQQASKAALEVEAEEGVEYIVKVDRNIQGFPQQLKSEQDAINGTFKYWFQTRGDRLRRPSGKLGGVMDQLEAMEYTASALSGVMSHSDMIAAMRARAVKTYPKEFFDDNGNLRELSQFTPAPQDVEAYGRAKTFYNYINQLQQEPTIIDDWWKETMITIDKLVSRVGNPTLSKVSSELLVKRLTHMPPGRAARAVTFTLAISLNPIRQLLLQSSSAIHMSGISPLSMGKAIKDMPLMLTSFVAKDSPASSALVDKLAIAAGYKPKEWREAFNAFLDSGKYQSIDSSLFVGELNYSLRAQNIPSNILEQGYDITRKIVKSPVTLSKAVGFDAGEIINHMVSWNFERHRYGKGWNLNQLTKDEVSANSRVWAFDMTKTGAFEYQRGWFASSSQFLAINQKALLNMLPVLGNKRISKVGRAKYALGVFALYGMTGFDIGEYRHQIEAYIREDLNFDVPPSVMEFLIGGSLDITGNYLMSQLGNGTEKLMFSETFAPTSDMARGTWPVAVASALMEDDQEALKLLTGASYAQVGSLVAGAQAAKKMYDYEFTDSVDMSTKLMETGKRFASDFGVFSQATRYKLALSLHDTYDKWFVISKKSNLPITEVTKAQFMSNLLAGVELDSLDDLYNEVYKTSSAYNKSIEDDSKALAKEMARIYADSPDLETALERQGRILRAFGTSELMRLEIREKGIELYHRTPEHFNQMIRFSEQYISLNPEQDIDRIKQYLWSFEGLTTDQKEILSLKAEGFMTQLKAAEQVMNQERTK